MVKRVKAHKLSQLCAILETVEFHISYLLINICNVSMNIQCFCLAESAGKWKTF